MRKFLKIGFLFILVMTLTSAMSPERGVVFDDVGNSYVMPEDQTNVDMVFNTTQGLTTYSYDQRLEDKECIYAGLRYNQVNNFSTGDVAVNLGLRSASKTTSINLMKQPVDRKMNSQREYRLDIGEPYPERTKFI